MVSLLNDFVVLNFQIACVNPHETGEVSKDDASFCGEKLIFFSHGDI